MKIANYQVSIGLAGIWLLCLAGLIAAHFGIVAPRGRAVAASRAELDAAAEWFTSLKNSKSEREQARLVAEREDMESRFAAYVFSPEQLNQLDFELRALSEKNQLTDFSARHVRSATKVGAAELKKIAQREMVLSFNCAFADFLRFINELERHYPLMMIDAFTPSAPVEKGGILSCTLECSLLYESKSN